MKAIILAGGKATRLPESAKDLPKALVEVGNKSILRHQIDQLLKHGFFDIRLALGYRAEQIIEWLEKAEIKNPKLRIDWVIEQEPLDTGGAIKFASSDLREPFLVLNGDVLSDIDFTGFYKRFRERRDENLVAVYHVPDARSYGMIKKNKGRIVRFLEKPSEPVAGHINAGFYILSPHIFKDTQEKKFSIEKGIFPQLASNGQLGYYIHRGFWTDAGTEERLKEVRALFIS